MSSRERINYITDAVFFVVIPVGKGVSYCSGVNISRFLPVTRGRHKAMSNPAVRGLQLVNLEIRSLAIQSGATTHTLTLNECMGIAPTDDIWYTESILIENPPVGFEKRIIEYGVVNLLKKINKAIMLGADMPEEPLSPQELSEFIDDLCRRYSSD